MAERGGAGPVRRAGRGHSWPHYGRRAKVGLTIYRKISPLGFSELWRGLLGVHSLPARSRRGHSVTLFNRGRTNDELFPDLETITGDRGGDLSVLEDRKWDAVIDNSGYVPRHVQNSAATLAPNIGQYLFISSISVYDSWKIANDEDTEARMHF